MLWLYEVVLAKKNTKDNIIIFKEPNVLIFVLECKW